jgi:hypothetical protein
MSKNVGWSKLANRFRQGHARCSCPEAQQPYSRTHMNHLGQSLVSPRHRRGRERCRETSHGNVLDTSHRNEPQPCAGSTVVISELYGDLFGQVSLCSVVVLVSCALSFFRAKHGRCLTMTSPPSFKFRVDYNHQSRCNSRIPSAADYI